MTMVPVCRCTTGEALAGHTFPHCPYHEPCGRCGGSGYDTTGGDPNLLPPRCRTCDGTGAKGWRDDEPRDTASTG